MTEPGDIPLFACATDAKYLPHCATMLASLFAFNPGARAYVLCGPDVSEAQQRQLGEWAASRGCEVRCLVPGDEALPPVLPHNQRLPRTAWLRILLPELLPDVSRVIYLDVDMIVQDDLRELWTVDLKDNLVGAVTNVPHWKFHPEVGLGLPMQAYFNSGLLVMDLDGLRRERLADQAFRFARETPHLVAHADQAPLNALLHERRLPLHLRWNVQSPIDDGEAGKPLPFTDREIEEARRRPAIIHYSGNWKPWQFRSRHPLRHLYAQYRAQTPWPVWELEGKTLKHGILRLIPEYYARRLTEAYWVVRTAIGLGDGTQPAKRS